MKETFLQLVFLLANNWVPFAFYMIMIIGAGYVYRFARLSVDRRHALLVRLIIATVGFRIVYAAFMTGLQYWTQANDALGKLLLPPTQSITVFLRYSWTHFWINVCISLAVGAFMFIILRALQKKNPRFFEDGEIELGALLALAVGWPHFVVFFPMIFIFVLLFSIFRGVVFKEPFTTLGLPMIASALIAMVTAMAVLSFLRLNAWII